MPASFSVLVIITGSVSAYKSLEVIRQLRRAEIEVEAVLTKGGAEFITPLAVSSLTGKKTYTDLFSRTDEVEMGHIQLSRKNQLILVCPASADIMAKMVTGQADDLASTLLLATDKPVFVVPAMNHKMWSHPATQRNVFQLGEDGIRFIGPEEGEMACGEFGLGRMAEPEKVAAVVKDFFFSENEKPLKDKRVLVTAGPTYEAIDPVRFIGNYSSGKQGIAIAREMARLGAQVQLVLGPVREEVPQGVVVKHVTSAVEMLEACKDALPADIAICTAAVSDWAPQSPSGSKIKKTAGKTAPQIDLKENPDILHYLSGLSAKRPSLVVGFAAETENLEANATEKRRRKQCDWVLANNVSEGKVFGADRNAILFLSGTNDVQEWNGTKAEVAHKLGEEIVKHFRQIHSEAA